MILSTPTMLMATLMGACVNGSVLAPYTAVIYPPEEFLINWSEEWNSEHDGEGVVLFADIVVEDSSTDLPLEQIQIEVLSTWEGIYVLPAEAILTVSYPEAPEDWQEGYEEYCYDDAGNFDPSENEWCTWYYDELNGSFYEIAGDYADAGDFSPNMASGETDKRGIFRVFIYVDTFPGDQAPLWISIGVDSTSFSVKSL